MPDPLVVSTIDSVGLSVALACHLASNILDDVQYGFTWKRKPWKPGPPVSFAPRISGMRGGGWVGGELTF